MPSCARCSRTLGPDEKNWAGDEYHGVLCEGCATRPMTPKMSAPAIPLSVEATLPPVDPGEKSRPAYQSSNPTTLPLHKSPLTKKPNL